LLKVSPGCNLLTEANPRRASFPRGGGFGAPVAMNAITLPDHYTDTRKIELLASRGFDPEQISEILDLSVGRVERTIKTAASRAIDEHRANIIREIELQKLDELEQAHYAQAVQPPVYDSEGNIIKYPDKGSGEFVLKTMERRAKLAGLDIKPDANINVTTVSLVGALSDMAARNDKAKERIINAKVVDND
jgi:hypothetical protein